MRKAMKYGFLSVIAVAMLFPIVFVIINSFLSPAEMMATYFGKGYVSIKLIPEHVTLSQYYQAFFRRPVFLEMFWNSALMTASIVLGQVVICTLGAYAFAKLEFPGRDKIFMVFIILLILPPQATLVANYITLDRLNLVGGYLSVILPGMFSAFGVCLLRQYMRYIPSECCESATIDGASAFGTFWHIVLPQSKGGIGSLVILSFIDNWNMIEQPLVLLKDASLYPMSIYLSRMGDYGIAFAFGVVFLLPPVLLYLIFEEDFVKGIKL